MVERRLDAYKAAAGGVSHDVPDGGVVAFGVLEGELCSMGLIALKIFPVLPVF